MKKTIYSLILVVASLAALTACSKKDFDSKYYDPSKTTTVTPDKMMTGTFMAGRDYTYNAYWRMYTWDNYFGKLAQTIGFGVQSGTMYFINDGYASDTAFSWRCPRFSCMTICPRLWTSGDRFLSPRPASWA